MYIIKKGTTFQYCTAHIECTTTRKINNCKKKKSFIVFSSINSHLHIYMVSWLHKVQWQYHTTSCYNPVKGLCFEIFILTIRESISSFSNICDVSCHYKYNKFKCQANPIIWNLNTYILQYHKVTLMCVLIWANLRKKTLLLLIIIKTTPPIGLSALIRIVNSPWLQQNLNLIITSRKWKMK